jgi:hypothetical protein
MAARGAGGVEFVLSHKSASCGNLYSKAEKWKRGMLT